MTTFLDGYYKLDNHFCNILMVSSYDPLPINITKVICHTCKVENGSCAYFDGLDKKFPLLVEYGDFGIILVLHTSFIKYITS